MANTKVFKTPIVDFQTTTAVGRRYSISSEGFLYYDRLPDLAKQGNLQPQYLAKNQTLEYGAQTPPMVCQINQGKLKGFIPRPFLRQSPQVDTLAKSMVLPLEQWTRDYLEHNYSFIPADRNTVAAVPAHGVEGDSDYTPAVQEYHPLKYWDIVPSADGLYWEMTQKETGNDTEGNRFSRVSVGFPEPFSEAVSAEDPYGGEEWGEWRGVCPNPFFVAGFRRATMDQETMVAELAAFAQQVADLDAAIAACTSEQSALKRALIAKKKQLEDPTGGLMSTQIVFGDGMWLLWIPFKGRPILYRDAHYVPPESYWGWLTPEWVACDWTDGDLTEIDPERAANQGYTYHIGVIKGCVCVAEGSWDGRMAYYDASGLEEPVVPSGKLYIQNYPGQCTFWLDLIQPPVVAELGRRKFWVGPNTPSTIDAQVWGAPGDVMRNMNGTAVTEEDSVLPGLIAGTNKVDIEVFRDVSNVEYLYYVMKMVPGAYYTLDRASTSGTLGSLYTFTLPFVEAVSVWQPTVLTDNGAVTFESTDAIIPQGVSFDDELKGSRAQSHSFKLYNGQPRFVAPEGVTVPTEGLPRTYKIKPGAQVKASVSWLMFDTVTGADSLGEVVEAGEYTIVRVERDKTDAAAAATDLLGLAALGKWTREELNFRGWYLSDALEFLCDLQAIGAAQRDFEDLGTDTQILDTDGDGRDEKGCSFKAGDKYAEIMVKLVERYGQGAVLYYDRSDNKLKTGCKYCRTKRTTAEAVGGSGLLEWMTHQDNGWASTGCLAADALRNADSIDVHVIDSPEATGAETDSLLFTTAPVKARVSGLEREGYANEIVVTGKHKSGLPLSARWRNPDAFDRTSDQCIEVRVTKFVDLGDDQTQESVNEELATLVFTAAAWPLSVDVELALHPEIKVGWVMQVHGGSYAAVDQKLFRVAAVRHDVGSRETKLEGREINAVIEES